MTIHAGIGESTSRNNSTYIPWYSYRSSIKEIVVSENVKAPAYIQNMFSGMTNLTKADLSGLDTSNLSVGLGMFGDCSKLTKVKIGPKTLAKNIFGTTAFKGFLSEDGKYGPYKGQELGASITEKNVGWYDIVNIWGTCLWDLSYGILTIHSGAGENTFGSAYRPWDSMRDSIYKIIITDNVIAPENISYLFYDMKNLTSLDLSGLNTSNATTMRDVFKNCPSLTTINIGPKTFDVDIFTGLDGKQLVSQANGAPLTPGNTGWYNVVDAD